jgi:hypothetical protein
MAALTGLTRQSAQSNILTFVFDAAAVASGDTVDVDFGNTGYHAVILKGVYQHTTVDGDSTSATPEFHNSATLGTAGTDTDTRLWVYPWGDETPGLTVAAGSPEVILPTTNGHLYYRPNPDSTGTSLKFKLIFELP